MKRTSFRQAVLALGVLMGAATTAVPPVVHGAEPAELDRLLKTFAEEFVDITPGEGQFPKTFPMGSETGQQDERPVREMTLSKPFSIAKYEMPQNLYEAVTGANPSRWKGARNSAEFMTRAEAIAFCQKATSLMQARKLIGPKEIIRLPTEVEWEYCCRAGTNTAYSFGEAAQGPGDPENKARLLDPYAWHNGNAAGNDPPVGALKPNPWGLYDMHGYLWEFTSSPYEAAKPGEPTLLVVRGGSWKDRFDRVTSSSRRALGPNGKDDAVGFRCVKSKSDR